MRIVSLLLSWVLLAQAQEPIPILFNKKSGIVRKNLVGAWNLGTVNLLRWSEALDNAAWGVFGSASVTGPTVVSLPAESDRVYQILTNGGVSGVAYTLTVLLSGTGTTTIQAECTSANTKVVTLSATPTEHSISTVCASNATIYIFVAHREPGNTATSVTIGRAQLNEGSTALPYQATTDLQTVPNIVSGGPALQLGSTSGADTNDPVRRRSKMVLSTDDFLKTTGAISLPASHSLFSVVNSSDNSLFIEQSASINSNPGSYMYGGGASACSVKRTGSQVTYDSVNWQGSGWVDLGCVFSSTVNGYKNGLLHGIGSAISDTGAASDVIYVGSRGGTSLFTNGSISYVLLYNRALTPAEIRRNHQWLRSQMADMGEVLP